MTSTLNTNTHRCHSEIVDEAIERSKLHDTVVRIECLHAGETEEVGALLFLECEGSADNGGSAEYWGEDLDGNDWRVHVVDSSKEASL